MGDNGTNGNGRDDGRDSKGKFVTGNRLAKGRPAGTLCFAHCIARKAGEKDVDLEERLWQIFEKLSSMALGGDLEAAKVLFDRLCGPLPTGPQVAMQFNHNGIGLDVYERHAHIMEAAREDARNGLLSIPGVAEDVQIRVLDRLEELTMGNAVGPPMPSRKKMIDDMTEVQRLIDDRDLDVQGDSED